MSHKRNSTKQIYLQSLATQDNFLYETVDNLSFNFKFFCSGNEYGESFEDWQRCQILAEFNTKLKDFSGKKIHDLILDGILEIYPHYPSDSNFDMPKSLKFSDIKWARLRLTGRKRVIGFFLNDNPSRNNTYELEAVKKGKNIFYIVFLDKNHSFAPCKKK
ncbi:MAG: hypothetical protein IJ587_04975 [Synergistaceae bacterium]|nr:hypothetical protein [Synergistaceae bacterium]